MRRLREYQRLAHTEHWCDRCCTHIYPGEMYEGTVFLYEDRKKYRLDVLKCHIYPACEFPPDPSEEEVEMTEKLEIEDEVIDEELELPLAA